MDFSALHNHLTRLPMLRAFVPFAAGIVLAEYYALPPLLVWAGFSLCGIFALTGRSSVYILATLLLFGWGLAELHTLPPDPLPRSIRSEFAVTVGDDASATVTAWRKERTTAWSEADLKIFLRTDSTLTPTPGERLVVRAYLNDFPENAYGRLMRRRGYAGNIWIAGYSVLARKPAHSTTLHTSAADRLRLLGLPTQEHALCAAMAVGDRSSLTPELRRTYARSGTSHLLAVSGLHVGIVFLLVNALLWWLPLFRRGHLLRNAVAVALIWLYATTAGLSPSVIRAALMFSALQFSLASTSVYISGNVLAATALTMLIFRPAYLFDISFQLSFLAVAAILAWGIPLCRFLHCRYRALNALNDMLAIGLVASIATAPLAAHTFGIVSLVGIAINPLVIPLAAISVLGSVVWVLLPIPLFSPLLKIVAGTAARWQNQTTQWAAELPWGAVEWRPAAGQTIAVYAVMVAITLAAWSRKPKKQLPLAP